jgi:sterol desaturase/sphingolipid hydroxylase (fatty acid hydroxylase superfamily)
MGLFSIEHSQTAYRADFAFYAIGVSSLAVFLTWQGPPSERLDIVLLTILGLFGWSLLEYLVHRFVLHGVQPFARWHAAHHERPMALIGAPTLLTAALFFTVCFMPAWLLGDVWQASALTLGLVAGYLVYGLTHHAVHHWRVGRSWLRQLKLAHALHHHGERAGERPGRYGVTSGWWDRVFGS